MCGILGILNNRNIDPEDILNSFEKGAHRGPENTQLVFPSPGTAMGFHRLAINGMEQAANQPFELHGIYLVCNGEIYNHKELVDMLGHKTESNSDCEIILHLYLKFGIEETLHLINGSEFAFILYHPEKKVLYTARDPYGVRPLYHSQLTVSDAEEPIHMFSSELKSIIALFTSGSNPTIEVQLPGTYSCYTESSMSKFQHTATERYISLPTIDYTKNIYIYSRICDDLRRNLFNAVRMRVENTERPVACLLSGGLDSSLITALVNNIRLEMGIEHKLETYSIGIEGAADLRYARKVARHLGTNHTSIALSEQQFFDAIPEVIYNIESYDTTTVRASVGNYLISKYISENSEAKVIFNGDGADEVAGGYLYFHKAPNDMEFDLECRRVLKDIHYFDVLRSDKSISSNGLEARTPFLDRAFVQHYLSIPAKIRNHNNKGKKEKDLLRSAFDGLGLLPRKMLYRTKEAFSDGVSHVDRSWYQVIQDKIPEEYHTRFSEYQGNASQQYTHNPPTTLEQFYYRSIFESYYPNMAAKIPYFWMPRFVNATDCSARTLDLYSERKACPEVNTGAAEEDASEEDASEEDASEEDASEENTGADGAHPRRRLN
jgi:asparagine synthase (glutamine-hydrolysing)